MLRRTTLSLSTVTRKIPKDKTLRATQYGLAIHSCTLLENYEQILSGAKSLLDKKTKRDDQVSQTTDVLKQQIVSSKKGDGNELDYLMQSTSPGNAMLQRVSKFKIQVACALSLLVVLYWLPSLVAKRRVLKELRWRSDAEVLKQASLNSSRVQAEREIEPLQPPVQQETNAQATTTAATTATADDVPQPLVPLENTLGFSSEQWRMIAPAAATLFVLQTFVMTFLLVRELRRSR